MKRADISAIWPDATREQIDHLLDLNGADVNKARGELESLQAQLAEAQKKIGELQAGHYDAEKAQQQISQLQSELDGMKNAEAIRLTRQKVAGEKQIPIDLLTGTTEEECASQADAILAFAKPTGYPVLRDGGSPTTPVTTATRDRFAAWAADNL